MAAASTIAIVGASLLGGLATGAQVHQSRKAGNDAKKQAKIQLAQAQQREGELRNQRELSDAEAVRIAQQRRRRAVAADAGFSSGFTSQGTSKQLGETFGAVKRLLGE